VPRSQFDGYKRGTSNTALQQATAIIEQFLAIMGWPAGVNAEDLASKMLEQGLELSPARAYNWLFTQIPEALQEANPNAEFGMTQDTYVSSLNAFRDSFESFTGTPEIPHDVLRIAIDQGWTQSQMMQFLKNDARYSDPTLLPWLSAGMGYRDVANQFHQTYGSAPTDRNQLASWFRFKTGAQQVGQSQGAHLTTDQGPKKEASQSETR
jgi:hypothetical protein